MPVVSAEQLSQLQYNPSNIRNICILAHIDHGKTTLSDLLIASNGIISNKLAGKIRYLDSREDEQQRGITMKSSAISLLFRTQADATRHDYDSYLINLIDSPGHVDFSSEVSTSLRLCDGALVLVDAVEGVCSQTHEVLRQAWHERVRPILVINKIDRLVVELQYTPMEAYKQLKLIVDEMNIIMSTFASTDWLTSNASSHHANGDDTGNNDGGDFVAEDDVTLDDTQVYFRPGSGNVIFASATDGWAFSLPLFAKLYAQKLAINEKLLRRTLWGDFFYDPSSKKVYTAKKASVLKLHKPLFVQCVLENIWTIYKNTILTAHQQQQLPKETLEKIAKSLSIQLIPRDFTSKDVKALAQKMLSAWLPLAKETLLTVIEQLPSPKEAQRFRLKKILLPNDILTADSKHVLHAMETCDASPDAPVVVYVSKLFPQHDSSDSSNYNGNGNNNTNNYDNHTTARDDRPIILPQNQLSNSSTKSDIVAAAGTSGLIGFARVFSGILHSQSTIYLLHPKYTYNHPIYGHLPHVQRITIGQLFLLMGRHAEPLLHVPAGNILGIAGLDAHVLKTATLSSTLALPNFGVLSTTNYNLVQVAVSPVNPLCLSQLVAGLHLLHLADPAVNVSVKKSTGEYVISAAGELHLERCLKDLEEQYAKTALRVGEPIIHYRETVVASSKEKAIIDIDHHRITLTAVPLPVAITDFIVAHEKQLRLCQANQIRQGTSESAVSSVREENTLIEEEIFDVEEQQISLEEEEEDISSAATEALEAIHSTTTSVKCELEDVFKKCHWGLQFQGLLSFGPDRYLPNALIYMMENDNDDGATPCGLFARHASTDETVPWISRLVSGFKLAVAAGPLCHEPWQGVAIIAEHTTKTKESRGSSDAADADANAGERKSSGQWISLIKTGCQQAVLHAQPRLMLGMYDCVIQTDANALGKMYSVLSKRQGQVVSSEVKEGTSLFIVNARLPVVESFGFADELRKKTSGIANPQLLFGGWELLDQDPLGVLEDGFHHDDDDDDDREKMHRAKKYMIEMRKTKGLPVVEKLVEHAEKQRTLKRT